MRHRTDLVRCVSAGVLCEEYAVHSQERATTMRKMKAATSVA
jgi:hypothetical protein